MIMAMSWNLRQADQNPLAFPVSGTRPQSRWPAGGTGRSLETCSLGCGPAANWSGRKHSETLKTATRSVVDHKSQTAALHRVNVIYPSCHRRSRKTPQISYTLGNGPGGWSGRTAAPKLVI